MFVSPRYRYLAQKYNFDDYSSKGSTVHSVKKYNRNMTSNMAAIEGPSSDTGANTGESSLGYPSRHVVVGCHLC